MRFFKAVLIYLFVSSIIGVVFASSDRGNNYIWPILMYGLISGYLIFIYFKGTRGLIFGSLLVLFLIQLISIETESFSYLFTIGLHFFNNFKMDGFSVHSTVLGLSNIDFTPVLAGEPEIFGVNLLAFVFLLLIIVNQKK